MELIGTEEYWAINSTSCTDLDILSPILDFPSPRFDILSPSLLRPTLEFLRPELDISNSKFDTRNVQYQVELIGTEEYWAINSTSCTDLDDLTRPLKLELSAAPLDIRSPPLDISSPILDPGRKSKGPSALGSSSSCRAPLTLHVHPTP